jgi:sortase A
VDPTPPVPEEGRTLALLEIPAIELSIVVVGGTGTLALNRGVGHIAGTALPGAVGNVALAAHRDTFFARLGELVPGNRIVLRTDGGVREYAVESAAVVGPKAVHVLDPSSDSVLTLVTCYPFRYVGAAPERYVVRASSAGAR